MSKSIARNTVSFVVDRPGLIAWEKVRTNLPKIRQYGQHIGILAPPSNERQKSVTDGSKDDAEKQKEEAAERAEQEQHEKREKGVNIPVKDTSRIHQAIPFLPFYVALVCLFLNIAAPGGGTILSGFAVLVMGYPRLQVKELARVLSTFINLMVGCCQFLTVPILLMGWFWSIAWGSILMFHALQYREAMRQKRQAQVATVALEALTSDTLLRRREVHNLVRSEREGKRKKIPLKKTIKLLRKPDLARKFAFSGEPGSNNPDRK